MNLLASMGVAPNNTREAAIGGILLDGMRDVPITIQMSHLNLGGHVCTGLLLEAYAGDEHFEVFAQLPPVSSSCDHALRVLLMMAPPAFVMDTLIPMVRGICRVLSRPMPRIVEGDFPATNLG